MATTNRYKNATGSTIGQFGKAIRESFSVSFSPSGAKYCVPSCRLISSCYAQVVERIYSSLERKLQKHARMQPATVANRAIADLQSKPDREYRWARLSVDGTLPARQHVDSKRWKLFSASLRRLVSYAQQRGCQWHIPVESLGKARSYRKMLAGLGVTVRRTSQATTVARLLESTDARSWVVIAPGQRITAGPKSKDSLQANIEHARSCAVKIRKAGKSVVLCPAIARDSKCGRCTACAKPKELVEIVLYPYHN